MLQADSRITAKAVRERLHNEYGATPSYPAVRHLHRDPPHDRRLDAPHPR
jgi:hypothetical protein